MSGRIHVAITEEEPDLERAIAFVQDPAHGALVTFMGRIRNHNLGRSVRAVEYDVFEPLAVKLIQENCKHAQRRVEGTLHIYVEHFKGMADVGASSVVIAVSSAHRREAFDVCPYIIEHLKHQVPIWKKEYYEDGETEWVRGHTLCRSH